MSDKLNAIQDMLYNFNIAIENRNLLDEFLNNKINFLIEEYEDKLTKMNYWKTFYNKIYGFEISFNKDLALFNEMEIESILRSQYTTSPGFLKYLKSLLNKYEEWALKVGLNPTYNPVPAINININEIIDTKNIRSKYVTLDELFDMWESIDNYDKDYQEFAAALLPRLGLKGKNWDEVKCLKYDDIDFKNNIINVTNRNKNNLYEDTIVKRISFDERVAEILEKAYTSEHKIKVFGSNRNEEILEYKKNGLIIKKIDRDDKEEIIGSPYFRNLLQSFFKKADEQYIAAKDLFRAAEIDKLLEIKNNKEWGKLENNDFKDVLEEFEGESTNSKYTALRDHYIIVTKDTDILSNRYKYDENGNRIIK
ncbi:MAG: hypothetical protein ACRC1T_05675 [Clostridium chrysemydis]|uniref:phage lytic cycle repressor MrpR family protein n=1 Tax=Clostridium chrysemydis TaxID=2665504 RepID=UPI003F390E73